MVFEKGRPLATGEACRQSLSRTRLVQRDWSGGAGSILEGIDEIITVTRLGSEGAAAVPDVYAPLDEGSARLQTCMDQYIATTPTESNGKLNWEEYYAQLLMALVLGVSGAFGGFAAFLCLMTCGIR
jgi:hypothetical protein